MFTAESEIKGRASIPDLTSHTDLHSLILCKHACKVDCDIKSGIDPLPFRLGHIKLQDLLEEGNNGRNAFRTSAKTHFSEKIGIRGTFMQRYLENVLSLYLLVSN